MDLLRTAMVDITTLVATSRALRTSRLEGELIEQGKLRGRLKGELRRGTTAYLDTLARSKRGEMDGQLLDACRSAAEKRMPRAIKYREALSRLMSNQPGVLDGVVASRQDLWRLAHIAIHLRLGQLAIRDSGEPVDVEEANKLADRLRRRVRRALIAYARVSHREDEGGKPVIAAARRAAIKQIERQGEAEAQGLGKIEARDQSGSAAIRRGVVKPLHDLALDWRRPGEGTPKVEMVPAAGTLSLL